MAVPMTPSRFGNSYSGGSAPYAADAPSMADTLPSVDFAFNDLRERMASFTARFDDFIERGRKRVLEERNAFRMNVAELQGESVRPFCGSSVARSLTSRDLQRRKEVGIKQSQILRQSQPRLPRRWRKRLKRPRSCTPPSRL